MIANNSIKVGVYNPKGGSGKSSLVIGLLRMLKVNARHTMLYNETKKEITRTVVDCDDNTGTLVNYLRQSGYYYSYSKNKETGSVVRNQKYFNTQNLLGLDNSDIVYMRNSFEKALAHINSVNSDVVIADSPNRINKSDILEFCRTVDLVIIPVSADHYTTNNLQKMFEYFADYQFKVLFVFTKHNNLTPTQLLNGEQHPIHGLSNMIRQAGFNVSSYAIINKAKLDFAHGKGQTLYEFKAGKSVLVKIWNEGCRQINKFTYLIEIPKKQDK